MLRSKFKLTTSFDANAYAIQIDQGDKVMADELRHAHDYVEFLASSIRFSDKEEILDNLAEIEVTISNIRDTLSRMDSK